MICPFGVIPCIVNRVASLLILHTFIILANRLVELGLPLLICNRVTVVGVSVILIVGISAVSKVTIVRVLAVSKVALVGIFAVIEGTLVLVIALKVVPLGSPLIVAVNPSAVILVLLLGKQTVLVIHFLSLLVVLIASHAVKLGNDLGELREIGLISLIARRRSVRAAVTARHSRRLSHGVLHCELAKRGILILILLIQRIAIDVVREFLAVQNTVDHAVDLSLPRRLIFTGLCGKMRLKRVVSLLHSVALRVIVIRKVVIGEVVVSKALGRGGSTPCGRGRG